MRKIGDYITTSEKGANDGVATLDNSGQVPANQLGNAGGGGGNTIYTANDSLTGDRIVSLDSNDLTFNCGTNGLFVIDASSTTENQVFTFQHNGNTSFFLTKEGKIQNTDVVGNNVLDITNASKDSGIILNNSLASIYSAQLLIRHSLSDSNGVRIVTSSNTEEIKWQQLNSSNFNHQIKSGSVSGSNEVRFFNKGWTNSDGFVIGGSSAIGSEDISLQGDTLINEKLELSATNHGILLNRVNNSEMSAISATNDEIVYNTQQEGLFRWNGSSWVALSAGYGIVGTTDSTGKPTFYATVKAAYIAGQGSVKLYSDVTETSANTISIVSGRDIDLNGYTYTYDVSDSSDVFEDTTSANTFRVINGRIIRKNATGGYVFNFNLVQTQIDVINVYAESENEKALSVRGTFNGFGSTFVSNSSSGAGVYFGTGAIVTGGKYIQKNNASNQTIGSQLNNVEWICEGSGQNSLGGNVFNCRLIANTGKGAYTGVTGTKIYDCYIYSLSGNGIDLRASSEAYNCTIISNASVCINTAGNTATKLIGCNISGSNSAYAVNNISLVEDCIITNTDTGFGKAIEISQNSKIINNTLTINSANDVIRVNSAGANSIISNNNIFMTDSSKAGIASANFDAYIVGNVVKGSTILMNLGTGSNLWTATTDAQGNTAQL